MSPSTNSLRAAASAKAASFRDDMIGVATSGTTDMSTTPIARATSAGIAGSTAGGSAGGKIPASPRVVLSRSAKTRSGTLDSSSTTTSTAAVTSTTAAAHVTKVCAY